MGRTFADPQTGVAKGRTFGRNMRSKCRCSMCPAIHINSRSWLRSSSTHEPSDPPPKVITLVSFFVLRYRPDRRGKSQVSTDRFSTIKWFTICNKLKSRGRPPKRRTGCSLNLCQQVCHWWSRKRREPFVHLPDKTLASPDEEPTGSFFSI